MGRSRTFLAVLVLCASLVIPGEAQGAQESHKLAEFELWATDHGIELVGTNKGANYLYYNGFNPETDRIDWKTVPGVTKAAFALYIIPEEIIQVMREKTIYFSTQQGRSYTVLSSYPDYHILEGMNRGIILEQGINPYTVVHEVGHIVDFHGIQGIYGDRQNIFSDSLAMRNEVFATSGTHSYQIGVIPPGHITDYSVVNDAENFAEHFAFYLVYPDQYKIRVNSDPLLSEEYDFLKRVIFASRDSK